MLGNIIMQKANKHNVIVLIHKNYYVRMLEYIIIQKVDKSNVIYYVLINKNYYVRKYHYTESG